MEEAENNRSVSERGQSNVTAEKKSSKIPAVVGIAARGGKGDPNNGNLIHGAGARRLLTHYVELPLTKPWSDEEIEHLRSERSHIVYLTANAIRLGLTVDNDGAKELVRFQTLSADNIERAGLPVVVLGLGAQATIEGPIAFRVPKETLRLLKVLSDHSRKIAVRGAFTAEACGKLGIKNVEIVGCQSFFWHLAPHFTQSLSDPFADSDKSIAFNFTNGLAELNLVNQAIELGLDVIGQGNIAEEDLKIGAKAPANYSWPLPVVFERGLIHQERYETWIKGHFHQFHDADSWISHMRRYRFSYGTRFHGNMASLIAGTRALWIVHDMRTKELCDYLNLPYVKLNEVAAGSDVRELMERADYLECIKAFPERYRVLFDYLENADVPHSLPAPHGAWLWKRRDRSITELLGNPMPKSNGIRNVIQVRNDTSYDRYPWIFVAASEAVRKQVATGGAANILSFGCSRGEEAFTLADKYFTDSERILGVDISEEQIALARVANRYPERVSFEISTPELIRSNGPFDVIFALSVLCSWPETMGKDDISEIFSFERFTSILNDLSECLRVGGLLVIYNANYRFCDTGVYHTYRICDIPSKDSGFVSKFDTNGLRRSEYDSYNEIMFMKVA